MKEDAQDTLNEIIGRFDTAMLVTISLEGQPRARPMAILRHGADGSMCFASRVDDVKHDEILKVPEVAVTMQGDGLYLSVSGRARLESAPREPFTLPLAVKPWFPEGVDDPTLMLIVVEPDYAEYWDRSGLRQLQFLWEAGKALVRGKPLSDADVGGHDKLHPGAGTSTARAEASQPRARGARGSP